MLFVVRFTDKQDRKEVREQFLQAHVDWLDQHKQHVLVGGSLRRTPGEQPVGGLWIVEAESRSEIQQLIRSDPFWINGLRQNYEILHWSKAFADSKVPV
ncbi:MAG: YciI family protein [Gammaproteobacteria bacterium]|nr:YciI family protein [Gammaproteobacteria bacterium]MDH3412544.1 YciI family protein [Gammaproteobacteria bacterium]